METSINLDGTFEGSKAHLNNAQKEFVLAIRCFLKALVVFDEERSGISTNELFRDLKYLIKSALGRFLQSVFDEYRPSDGSKAKIDALRLIIQVIDDEIQMVSKDFEKDNGTAVIIWKRIRDSLEREMERINQESLQDSHRDMSFRKVEIE